MAGQVIASNGPLFTDNVAREMLIEPEAQFFWSQLLFAATARFQLEMAGIEYGIDAAALVGAAANTRYPADIWNLMTASASPLAEAIVYYQEPGMLPGGKVRINRPIHSAGGLTIEDRTLKPTQNIATTGTNERPTAQTEIQLVETGGPRSATDSAVTPLELHRYPTRWSNTQLTTKVAYDLRYDRYRFLEGWIGSQIFQRVLAANTLYAQGFSADNDITTANGAPLTFELVARVEQTMVENSVPPKSNGRWNLVCTSGSLTSLKLDPEFQDLATFMRDMNPIFRGAEMAWVATIGRLDIYMVQRMQQVTNSSGVLLDYNLAFGREVVGMAEGDRVRVGYDERTDYQRKSRVVWVGAEGGEVLDNRFLYRVVTTPHSNPTP